jgi:BASS family bile acid:Na+ symporter
MTVDLAVRLLLLTSIWLIVLSLGARASIDSAAFVLRRPALLLRALAAMFVVAPALAVLLAVAAPLPAPIRFAIVAMSVAPVPPILPRKQMKAGGGGDYTIGLLVAASVVAVVATPLLVDVIARLLGAAASVTPGRIARTLLMSIGLPLAAGMLLKAVWRAGGEMVARHAQSIGMLLLLVGFAAMVGAAWREILALLGNGTALAIATIVAVDLAAGHILSGGREEGALALAASNRHPGVALAIAQMSYPDRLKEITAAILLYLVITMIVTAPYVRWIRGRAARAQTAVAGRA